MSEAVYREFSRDEFESQYNPRLLVPDSEQYTQSFARRSESFRATANCVLDVEYGPAGRERLDLFKPASAAEEPGPVLLYIHGGYWRSRDKSLYSFIAEPFVEAGALIAVMSYSLCPHVTLDHIVTQARAAGAWLWRHAGEHGGDASRLHVMGHSAGGHLAAMLAATDWSGVNPDLPDDLVCGATMLSGLYDLEPIALHSINETLNLKEASVRRSSPVRLKPTCKGPLLIAVGARESSEFNRLATDLDAAWRQHSEQVELVTLPGIHHFSIVDGLADRDFEVTRRVLEQLAPD